jgi:choline-sulfatase
LLLIMTDQQRADAVGYANPLWTETTEIDAIARKGTWFSNAYSASTTCVPARSALLTGIFDHRLPRAKDRKALQPGYWTMAHALRQAGYRTGLFGKMHFSPIAANHGFEVQRSCEHLTTYASYDPLDRDDYRRWIEGKGLPDLRFEQRKEKRSPYSEELHPATWMTDEAISFIDGVRGKEPFLAVVSYTGPHTPHDPPEPWYSRHPASTEPVPSDGFHVNARLPVYFRDALRPTPGEFFKTQLVDEIPGDAVRAHLAAIRALIHQVDYNVGRLLSRVDLADTLVCFTSDHGDYGGHRGLLGKVPWIPFDDLAKVPLFYAGAGVTVTRRVDAPVQSSDVALTFLEAAGVLPAQHFLFDSRSLLDVLGGAEPDTSRAVHSSLSMGWPMIRRGRFKMIVRLFDGLVLFDLEDDPGETTDVAALYPDIREEFRELVREQPFRPRLDLWADPDVRDEAWLATGLIRHVT